MRHTPGFLLVFFVLLWTPLAICAQPIPASGLKNLAINNHLSNLPNSVTTGSACNTWVFQSTLGTTAFNETISSALSLPDGSYVLAGSISSGTNGGNNGLIVRLDGQGNIIWSKVLPYSSSSTEVKDIRQFRNGSLYLLGNITDLQGISKPFIAEMDTNGNMIWTKIFDPMSNTSWEGIALAETREDYFTTVMQTDSAIMVCKIDLSGTIIWSKGYRANGLTKVIGIINEYADVDIAYNEVYGGIKRGVVFSLDYTTGSYKVGCTIGTPGTEYVLQNLGYLAQRPRITGLIYKSGIPGLMRINYAPGAGYTTWIEEFNVNGVTANASLLSVQDDTGENISFTNNTMPGTLYQVNTFLDNYIKPVTAVQLSLNTASVLKCNIKCNDGGFLRILNSSSPTDDLTIIKTDTIGSIPNCGSNTVNATVTATTISSAPATLSSIPGSFSFFPLAILTQAQTLNNQIICKSLHCPIVPEPESCARTFVKGFRSDLNRLYFSSVDKISENRLMVIGFYKKRVYDQNETNLLALFDTLGNLVDAKDIEWKEGFLNSRLLKLQNGNFLISGLKRNDNGYDDLWVVTIDDQLNTISSKKIQSSIIQFGLIADIIESGNGDLFFYINEPEKTGYGKYRYLMKTDMNMNVQWMKRVDIGTLTFGGLIERYGALTEMGGYIYLKFNEQFSEGPLLMKIDKANGTQVWTKKYMIPNSGVNGYNSHNMYAVGNYVYLFGTHEDRRPAFMKISSDGDLIYSKKIAMPGTDRTIISVKRNGSDRFIFTSTGYFSPNYINGIYEIDTSFTVVNKQFFQTYQPSTMRDITPYNDSVSFGVSSIYATYYGTWVGSTLQKYNFNSFFGSCGSDLSSAIVDAPMQVTSKTVPFINVTPPVISNYSILTRSTSFGYSQLYCASTNTCTSINVSGNNTICDTAAVYTYLANKNLGCDATVFWDIDSLANQVQVISKNDSFIRIKANKGGVFKIKPKIHLTCSIITDSITVNVIPNASTFSLGKDTILCPGQSLTLRAGPGHLGYLWQDGSTDSTLVVSATGTYSVAVTSLCGGILHDTIIITNLPPRPLSAGADRIKCNNDTVQLSATPGFMSYSWSPNYNISAVTGANIVVRPAADTSYIVKAVQIPGCFVYDTVRISVKHSPLIDLGTDTSFCNGDSLQLNAGGGFNQFTWNTGNQSQAIIAKTAGSYAVNGVTAEGCVSTDTITVLKVYANPVVQLDKTTYICNGETRVLDPGAGFSSYLWSSGSTGQTISVNGPGIYWVKVKDFVNCAGSDTAKIVGFLPQPRNFLPLDTAICTYGIIELKPSTPFINYLWSTNLNSPTISITKPGLYWLVATDMNNCKGIDSIVVNIKNCNSGFYIPTAFTPNKDFRNDSFKPMLFGQVVKYEFYVYNRYGQLIFKTNDISKGWEGNVNGESQNTGAFVWRCIFQFENEPVTTKNGTVVLIR
ncbi:MAG: T9SS type B sorting domain-containing protein [Bacteroidota bacterium]